MKIVHQRDAKDCGVCALASIINHYGGYVSLEKLRLDTKTSNDGTTALNIVEASKKYGFDAIGIKVSNLKDKKIFLPAIAHVVQKNGFNHYVVIYKITAKNVILMDPAKGKVVKTKDEFYEEWSHVLLLFRPKRKIAVFKKEDTLIRIFLKIALHEKKLFLLIIFTSIFLIAFTIASSYYFQVMITAINLNYFETYIKILGIIFAIILALKLIFNYIRNYLKNYLNKNIDCLLNSNFIEHIFNLPLDAIISRTSGEIITRVSELNNIKNLFVEIFITCFLDLLLMLAALPLLHNISSNLSFILWLCLLLYLLVGLISSKIIYKKAYANIELDAEFNNVLLENINMISSIKNLHVTDKRLKRLENKLVNLLYDNFEFTKFINNETFIKNIITEVGFFIINTWGFYLIYQGKLELVSLITFNTILGLFLDPIKNCIDSLPKYNYVKASFSKINDFLSLNREVIEKNNFIEDNGIVVKNLTYSYDTLVPIFQNFNLKILPGSFVCFKGKSGSGKSTLCKMLDKYITDYNGKIFIGNRNIKDLSINTIRSNVTYVCQNENLITGSIKENILLDRDISEKRFYEACKICLVDSIIDTKASRYETGINDISSNISGGEKQRIILARALLNDFKILILDEALSEVDYKTEKEIIKNLRDKYKGKTIIYITHKNHDKLFDKIISIGGSNEL